jgi:hypothetical protein
MLVQGLFFNTVTFLPDDEYSSSAIDNLINIKYVLLHSQNYFK